MIGFTWTAGFVNKDVDCPVKKLGLVNVLLSFFYSSKFYPNNDFGFESWFYNKSYCF